MASLPPQSVFSCLQWTRHQPADFLLWASFYMSEKCCFVFSSLAKTAIFGIYYNNEIHERRNFKCLENTSFFSAGRKLTSHRVKLSCIIYSPWNSKLTVSSTFDFFQMKCQIIVIYLPSRVKRFSFSELELKIFEHIFVVRLTGLKNHQVTACRHCKRTGRQWL